jgi:hypothetical protein
MRLNFRTLSVFIDASGLFLQAKEIPVAAGEDRHVSKHLVKHDVKNAA